MYLPVQVSHQTCIGEATWHAHGYWEFLKCHIIWINKSRLQCLSLQWYNTHPIWLALTNELNFYGLELQN